MNHAFIKSHLLKCVVLHCTLAPRCSALTSVLQDCIDGIRVTGCGWGFFKRHSRVEGYSSFHTSCALPASSHANLLSNWWQLTLWVAVGNVPATYM